MRVDFVKSIQKLMREDSKALFITGDLGFNAFEGIREEFPDRFLNAGAAEQNMISAAAGMAAEGFRPWVYSIAPFVTYRCVEQIRNDVCLHNLPVRIVGNGGGYTYGIMGSTHHTLEDMAVLKALPNMNLFLPCTENHVEGAVRQIQKTQSPSYLRLGFSGFPSNKVAISENPQTLTRTYALGTSCTIVGIGQGTQIALHALEKGIIQEDQAAIFGIAKFPLDLCSDKELLESCKKTEHVVVIEEHYLPGSIAESLKMALPPVKSFQTLTPTYSLNHSYGNPSFQLEQAGVTPTALKELLSANPSG